MIDDLTWRFDVAVIEWLIFLAVLVILSFVGALLTHNALKAHRKLKDQANGVSKPKCWHTESTKTVFKSFATTQNGLSKEEVVNRRVKHGPNQLPETKTRGPLLRFFYHFHNVLM